MKYVEVVTHTNSQDSIRKVADNAEAKDLHFDEPRENSMQRSRMILDDEKLQKALDSLSVIIGANPQAKILVMPVEAFLPQEEKSDEKEKLKSITATREAIYTQVEQNAHINNNYILLIILSTIVASIGLLENNVAVLIGAMVIAPLLGPNIALSLATSLGDTDLMLRAIKTLITGLALAIGLSASIALVIDIPLQSQELLSRTYVGYDSVILAFASGAAAALSITTGLSSVLVGVMVAVAILPPAAAFGMFLADGNYALSLNAGVLLAVNIVCVNLASKLVFLGKSITPRKWLDKQKAKRAMRWYMIAWVISLCGLLLFIYFHPQI